MFVFDLPVYLLLVQVDLSVLFKSRQPAMSHEEAARLAEDWNEDLEKMEGGVLVYSKYCIVYIYEVIKTRVAAPCHYIWMRLTYNI